MTEDKEKTRYRKGGLVTRPDEIREREEYLPSSELVIPLKLSPHITYRRADIAARHMSRTGFCPKPVVPPIPCHPVRKDCFCCILNWLLSGKTKAEEDIS